MESRLAAELLSGKGPDVILLNQNSHLDIQRLAKNGALLDLQWMLSADGTFSLNDYFSPLMDACKMDGLLIALPFSFSLPHLMTGEEKLREFSSGLDHPSFGELLDLMREEQARIAGQDRTLLAIMTRRSDMTLALCQASGIEIGEEIDEEAFRQVADFIRAFYDGLPQLQSITQRYRNDFVSAVGRIDWLLEDYQMPSNLRYYAAYYSLGLNDRLLAYPIPDFRDGGRLYAQIAQYGVVSSGTKRGQEAYALLRFLMDYPASQAFSRFDTAEALEIPARRALAQANIQSAMDTAGGNAMISKRRRPIPALDAAYGEEIKEWYDQIAGAYLPNRTLGDMIEACMTPYYQQGAEFSACFRQLQNTLWIYLNE